MSPNTDAMTGAIRRTTVDLMPIERDPRTMSHFALVTAEYHRPTDHLDKRFERFDVAKAALPRFDARLGRMVPTMAAFDLEDQTATCYAIRSQEFGRFGVRSDKSAVGPQVLVGEIDGPDASQWSFPFSNVYKTALAGHRPVRSELSAELGKLALCALACGIAATLVVLGNQLPEWWIAAGAGSGIGLWMLVRLLAVEWAGARYHTYLHARFRGAIPDEVRARILLERAQFDRVFIFSEAQRWSVGSVDDSQLSEAIAVGYRRTNDGDRFWVIARFEPVKADTWAAKHIKPSHPEPRTDAKPMKQVKTDAVSRSAPIAEELAGDPDLPPSDPPAADAPGSKP